MIGRPMSTPFPEVTPAGAVVLQEVRGPQYEGQDAMPDNSVQRKVHIRNPHGLHLRPITAFVELAKRYQSTVMVRKDDQCVDGKSPWDLLSLVALPGTELLLLVSGPDATEALQALGDLLENYVIPDEPESDLLPKS